MTQAYIFCKICQGIVAQFNNRHVLDEFKCPCCGVVGKVNGQRNWDGRLETLKRYLVVACINSNSGYMMRTYGWADRGVLEHALLLKPINSHRSCHCVLVGVGRIEGKRLK